MAAARSLQFQYPGDFCDYDRYVLPERDAAVAAVTDCLIGVILHEDIERIAGEIHESVSHCRATRCLKRASSGKRLLNVGQRPALERIASLLCEHIFRLEAVGIDSDFIPLTQIDLVMPLVFPWSTSIAQSKAFGRSALS
jgi:hypothetical protein